MTEKWSGKDIKVICDYLRKYEPMRDSMYLVEIAYVIKHWMKWYNFEDAMEHAHTYDINIPKDLNKKELDFIKSEIAAM